MKPARLRELAQRDIDVAVDHYAADAGEAVALRFIDALERALQLTARHPAACSARLGYELQLPGLRSRGLRGFPDVVFYIEREDDVDVWRVRHGRRDIPTWLAEPDS